jgi:FSR family fosmidomycin resistance protein-like MFS transporter
MGNPAAGIVTRSGRASAPGWNLRGLSVIAFAHGLSDFYSGIVPFTIFLVLARDHVSPAFQGALVFVWYVTSSIVQPLFGRYSDRHGQWWFLPAGVALTVTAISLAGHAPSIALLALCIVIGGFGSAIMHPEAGKYSAMLSGTRKASGISIFQIGGQIGYSVGPAVVAALYARYGTNGTLLLLAPGLLAVVWLAGVMRAVDRTAGRVHRAHSERSTPPTGPVDRLGVTLLVASTALRYFATAAFMTYLPNFLVGQGSSIPLAGQIVTAFLLVSSFGLLAGGALADRFGAVRISVVALAGAVPFLYAFFVLHGPAGVLALLCGSVLLAVQNAPGVALVQAKLPKNLGMALGLMNGVAFGIGSALVAGVGLAVAALGAGPALESVSAVPLLAAVACGFVGPRLAARVSVEAAAN